MSSKEELVRKITPGCLIMSYGGKREEKNLAVGGAPQSCSLTKLRRWRESLEERRECE